MTDISEQVGMANQLAPDTNNKIRRESVLLILQTETKVVFQ